MGKTLTGVRLAAAALLLAPLLAYSAGLDRLTDQSALGQPPSAEMVSLQPGEEGLEALIALQRATGRLVREYTFLLDPPQYKAPALAAAPAAPAPAPVTDSDPIAPTPAPAPAAAAPAAKPAGTTHQIKAGETLGSIARANKPEGVSLNQMLIALYWANQDAFIRGNINLVRAGRILVIPDREAVRPIDPAQANGLVKRHMVEFAEYRQKLAGIVAALPAPTAPSAPPAREVAGRIAPKPDLPAAAEPEDQLRLSKADPAKPGAAASQAARDDDRVARERALKEQQLRIGELEKNVSDLQKLVELKNRQLAELERKAAAAPAAPAPAPEAPPPDPYLVDEAENFVTDPVSAGGLAGVLLLLAVYGVWALRKKKSAQEGSQFQDSVPGAEAAKLPGEAQLGGISLDLGATGGAAPAGCDTKWQELATKFDLAKACEKMGDKEGARQLLNEVVKDGDAVQQAQARQMLGNLG